MLFEKSDCESKFEIGNTYQSYKDGKNNGAKWFLGQPLNKISLNEFQKSSRWFKECEHYLF